MGLEPTPTYVDMNLNHARMPIPPQLRVIKLYDYKENGNLAYTRFPSMQLTGLEPVRAQCSLDP